MPSTTKSYIVRYVLADFSRALAASGVDVPSEEEAELIMAGIQMIDAEDSIFPELKLQIEGATAEDRMKSTMNLLDSLGGIE